MLRNVFETGVDAPNWTGGEIRRGWSEHLRFDLRDGSFPAVTTKKLFFRSVVAELLWFLYGDTSTNILHSMNCHIWDDNVDAPYWQNRRQFPTDAGKIYGIQWRNWGGIDQLSALIHGLIKNPHEKDHILSAWNVSDLDDMPIKPCHPISNWAVQGSTLHGDMWQRSADIFVGVPFNIASYALLLNIFSKIINVPVGELTITFSIPHIYKEHFPQVEEQLSREPRALPQLKLHGDFSSMESCADLDTFLHDFMKSRMSRFTQYNRDVEGCDNLQERKDIKTLWKKDVNKAIDSVAQLVNYQHHPAIRAPLITRKH